METKKSKEFQRQIGMHPGEFLFSEFIWRQKDAIKKGIPIFLQIEKGSPPTLYRALIDRLCKKDPIADHYGPLFEVDLNKRRVRRILGLLS